MPRVSNYAHFLTQEQHLAARGWRLFDEEVPLEPSFCGASPVQNIRRLVDDGRIPSRIGTFFSRPQIATGIAEGSANLAPPPRLVPPTALHPQKNVTIRSYLPRELKIPPSRYEQLLSSLAFSSTASVSFEIVGTADQIAFQITCWERDREGILSQLKNHVPDVDFRAAGDLVDKCFPADISNRAVAVDFGLGGHWFVPLSADKEFAIDPLIPLIAVLEGLSGQESMCVQVMFGKITHPWQREARGLIFDPAGKPIFANMQNQLPGIKEKLGSTLFAVCLRLLVTSDSRKRSTRLVRSAGAYFKQFFSGGQNELIPLAGEGLDHETHLRSIRSRTTRRSGMLLTPQELSAIVRFPSDAVQAEKLLRDAKRTKRAPAGATQGTIILGENEHAGQIQIIKISPASHSLIIGGTGTGKTTLALNEMTQILGSSGGCVVDPHGDMVDDLMARIPEDRLKDVVLFDPADAEFPVGFNILQAHSEAEKMFLASDLVATFRRFSTSWGDVMDSVLANAVLAFVESSRGGTLFDLKRFLVEKEFRRDFLETVEDETVRYFWTHEFSQISGRTQSSVLIRLDTFLRQKLIRNIVCQKDSGLNLRKIFDERKILLIKLAQGLIGEEQASMLGTLLISKLYQIALTRQDLDPAERLLWPIFIDEAAHFVGNPSMSLILANLRKFGISLSLCVQSFKLLASRDAVVADSVLTNCQNRICFRLGDKDAERFAAGFSFFDANSLQNLGTGEAIMRVEKADNDFNLRTYPAVDVAPELAKKKKAAIVKNTRETWASARALVEEQFRFGRAPGSVAQHRPAIEDPQKVPSAALPTAADDRPRIEIARTQATVPYEHGHGGKHHQELQAVIKRMGEVNGFTAEIEKDLPSGGRVDVSLENDTLKIACEVSVTTLDYEVTNVIKCLDAGYNYALVVVSNQKKIPLLIAKLHASVPMEWHDQVMAFGLTGLLEFLRQLSSPKVTGGKRPEKPPGQRLDFTEACEFFGVGATTLYRWVREGRVPFYRPGREYQFDRDELVLIGKHDLSGKRKAAVTLSPLKIEKTAAKGKKEQDARYRKMLRPD